MTRALYLFARSVFEILASGVRGMIFIFVFASVSVLVEAVVTGGVLAGEETEGVTRFGWTGGGELAIELELELEVEEFLGRFWSGPELLSFSWCIEFSFSFSFDSKL